MINGDQLITGSRDVLFISYDVYVIESRGIRSSSYKKTGTCWSRCRGRQRRRTENEEDRLKPEIDRKYTKVYKEPPKIHCGEQNRNRWNLDNRGNILYGQSNGTKWDYQIMWETRDHERNRNHTTNKILSDTNKIDTQNSQNFTLLEWYRYFSINIYWFRDWIYDNQNDSLKSWQYMWYFIWT